ncbi:MAG: diacylglycerol kinase family protein [Hyphomicrobium sp.]
MEQRLEQCVVACIVNGRARSNEAERLSSRVVELFRAREARIDTVVVERGADLVPLARRYAAGGYTTIVAAGGDGTVSAVASALVDTPAALGVLPLGTLNHFARDAGIPLALEDAVETIIAGHTRMIDVGEVNGRIFVNNSSIGLYPAIVAERSELQRRGMRKWVAFAHAVFRIMRRVPHFHAGLHADGRYDGTDRTPFIFVGNNAYHAAGLKIGERQRLDGGKLWVCSAPDAGRAELIGMAARALFGYTDPVALKVLEAEELWVKTQRSRRVPVANDGELLVTRSPLYYRTRPKALRVIVPAGG